MPDGSFIPARHWPRSQVFTEFEYETKSQTWSRARWIIAKAEVTAQGDTSRFVVTNLPARGFGDEKGQARFEPQCLYEELYCGRGDMENVLKQHMLDLPGDRMNTHPLASNQ